MKKEQINELVKTANAWYASEGIPAKSGEEVLADLEAYMKDFTDYEDLEEVEFEELMDWIG